MKNARQYKHFPQPELIRCTEPGCNAWMEFLNSKPAYDVYACKNKYVRKIPKGSMYQPAA